MIEIKAYFVLAVSYVPLGVYRVLGLLLFVGLGVILFSQKTRQVQKTAMLMLIVWVSLIFCSAVVFREARTESFINLFPLWSYFNYNDNSYLKEMTAINLLNLLMFVPIGFLLTIGKPQIGWKKVLLLGFIFSSCIELSQFIFRKGLCEVDDVIHNVAGCMIGYGVATLTIALTLTIKKTITKKIRNEFI